MTAPTFDRSTVLDVLAQFADQLDALGPHIDAATHLRLALLNEDPVATVEYAAACTIPLKSPFWAVEEDDDTRYPAIDEILFDASAILAAQWHPEFTADDVADLATRILDDANHTDVALDFFSLIIADMLDDYDWDSRTPLLTDWLADNPAPFPTLATATRWNEYAAINDLSMTTIAAICGRVANACLPDLPCMATESYDYGRVVLD